jgi:hypothetical protein
LFIIANKHDEIFVQPVRLYPLLCNTRKPVVESIAMPIIASGGKKNPARANHPHELRNATMGPTVERTRTAAKTANNAQTAGNPTGSKSHCQSRWVPGPDKSRMKPASSKRKASAVMLRSTLSPISNPVSRLSCGSSEFIATGPSRAKSSVGKSK